MAFHLCFLVIFAGITGIQSITTVRKVSVKARQSITIPCLYDSQYTDNVKYLCRGYSWISCTYAVKTNQPNSVKYSISDDKSQRIFTVTIKDVTDEDYYCAVEIDGGSDVKEYFQLSVTRGMPSLYVDHQEITGFIGEKTSISCSYRNSGEMKWCRLGGSCVTTSGSIYGTRVTISATSNVSNVTMSELRPESSGWYWCAKGDFQMPVHVTVQKSPTTPAPADKVTTTEQGELRSVSVDLKKFLIPLSVLIFIVMVTLFIWFMLKRNKQTKTESLTTTRFAPSRQAEEEVTYSTVVKKSSAQRPDDTSDVDVTYSSVVTVKRDTAQRRSDDMSDGDVTYSSVVFAGK